MTNTELINYIREEIKYQGIVWKNEQEIFELILPTFEWKKFRSKWSSWKTGHVHYLVKSPLVLRAIEKRFFLESGIWDKHTMVQKEAVKRGVEIVFKKKRDKEILDISELLPKYSLNLEQKNLLKNIEKLSNSKVEELLESYPQWFKPILLNQPFLLELVNTLYVKGAYDLLVSKVFPSLVSTKRSNEKVKIIEAHCLGSLKIPKHRQAIELLNSIETDEKNKIIDIRTAALSNFRRDYLETHELNPIFLKDAIEFMIKNYNDIYEYGECYHYYPAINLVYVLVFGESEIEADKVYANAKESIAKDKASNNRELIYYASVSELEFLLLLGEKGVMQKMGLMLDIQKPSIALVHRTKRQMVEFVEMVKYIDVELLELAVEFEKVIGLLEDYEKVESSKFD